MPKSSISDKSSGNWSKRVMRDSYIYVILSGLSRGCMLSVLIASPWFFGAVGTNVQFHLYSAILIALSIWIVGAIWQAVTGGIKTNRLPLLLLPIVGAILLANYQLSPHFEPADPQSVLREIATSEANSESEDERPELGKAALIRSLQSGHSICPTFTRLQLARLSMVLAAFFLGAQLFATFRTQLWLWGALAINGAALSFFGICQQMSWNGKLFWTVPLRHGGIVFSSYVNRNCAAGYLTICLAASLGFLIWSWSKSEAGDEMSDYASDGEFQPYRARRFSLRDLIENLRLISAWQLLSAICVVLNVTGIVASMSRGGWLAMGVATVLTIVLTRKLFGATAIGLVLVVAAICVFVISWTGMSERINRRWDQFSSIDVIASDGRWAHWSDSLKAHFDFRSTGTDLALTNSRTFLTKFIPTKRDSTTPTTSLWNGWLKEVGLEYRWLLARYCCFS